MSHFVWKEGLYMYVFEEQAGANCGTIRVKALNYHAGLCDNIMDMVRWVSMEWGMGRVCTVQ